MKVELSGFKQAVVSATSRSTSTRRRRLNVKLEVGAISEAVTVTGVSPLLKTDRADVSTRSTPEQLTELPVLDRNFTKFILLTPGTQQLGWQHAASENPQGSTQTRSTVSTSAAPAISSTAPRIAIRFSASSSSTRRSSRSRRRRSPRRTTTPSSDRRRPVSCRCRPSRAATSCTAAASGSTRTRACRRAIPFTQFQRDPLTGQFLPDTSKNQFGGSVGGQIVENQWFFFGDYQGTRNTSGGSRLVTVPTAAARARRLQRATASTSTIPPRRARRAAAVCRTTSFRAAGCRRRRWRSCSSFRSRTRPGRENGTIDNYVASGSETFDGNAFNVRIDGRLRDGINTFGRYSLGDFLRDGPPVFGEHGGGDELGQPRRRVRCRATKASPTASTRRSRRPCSPTSGSGMFSYKVNVLPFDFGTTPAADAGIPGLNLDSTRSRPACRRSSSAATATAAASRSAPASAIASAAATVRSTRTRSSSSWSATSRSSWAATA